MLRITVIDKPESLTFQLEGRLAGAWLREVETCRQRILADNQRTDICFDLTGVTFIDEAGKAYLAAMHCLGVEFVATDCLTKEVVSQTTKAPITDSVRQKREVENQT
jgi:anti-anti-sigma regulatory factor